MNPAFTLPLFLLFLANTLTAQTNSPAPTAKPELTHRVLCGYQGWFNTPNDGSGRNWTHYGFDKPDRAHIDLWPDVSELGPDERHDTPLKNADGTPAQVFSSAHPRTVLRHFEWMQQHQIDGVFLQRFGTVLKSPKNRAHADLVLEHVRAASRQTGRAWALMYDLSGLNQGDILAHVMQDWKHLRNTLRIHEDPHYLHHQGKPLVAVWGIGFSDDRRYSLEDTAQLLRFLNRNPEFGGMATLAGVPTYWREGGRDATSDPARLDVFKLADVISPWSVGRYQTPAQSEKHITSLQPGDLAWCTQHQKTFLPVIFPGFSWRNLSAMRGEDAPLNAVPRLDGEFLWTQARARLQHGATSLYVAMFDELDEATAIMKTTRTPPVHDTLKFVNDPHLPSDHYLWLTSQIARALHSQTDLPEKIPARSF